MGDYRDLLTALAELGYRSVSFNDVQPDQPHLLLRHDVDLCLERALEIARLEHELGSKAIYYVLVSTRAYNPASAQSRAILREIASLGHAIGLHFDAGAYPAGADLESAAREECDILETLAKAPVESISFHRPVEALRNWQGLFAGRPHAYERRFFSDIGYVSDSSGGFYHGHPLDHPAVGERRAIQLLTHPIWWTADTPRSSAEALAEWLSEKSADAQGIADAAVARAATRASDPPVE